MATNEKITYQDIAREIAEMVAPGVAFQTQDESPLLAALGFPGRMGNTFSTQHDWLEERLLPNSTLTTAPSLAADTTLDVTAGTGTRFVVGDHLQAGNSREIMIVTNAAANVVTVTRGHLATTAADIATGDTITRIANPQLERATSGTAQAHDRQRRSNYTQVFRGVITVTNTRKKVRNLGGIQDEVRHQLTLLQRDKIRDLARAVVSSRQHNTTPLGSDTIPRTMDGIIYQILDGATATGGDPVAVDAATAPLDIALLDQMLRGCWERGGRPNVLAMNSIQLEALASVIEGRRRYTSREGVAGGRVNEYVSKFGALRVLDADVFIPQDVVLAVDTRKLQVMKLGTGRNPFDIFEQGKDGTSDEIEFEGEFTLEGKNAVDGGHGLLQNLAA